MSTASKTKRLQLQETIGSIQVINHLLFDIPQQGFEFSPPMRQGDITEVGQYDTTDIGGLRERIES